jgi:hypothetical protein
MFHLTTVGDIDSHYFDMSKTKSLNDSFKSYQFCLKDGVKFSDDSLIMPSMVVRNIEEIHKIKSNKLYKLKTIKLNKGCINLDLEKTDINYLSKLTTIDTAILKIPAMIGLGGYKLIHHSEKIIKLKSTKGDLDFKEVHFIKEGPETIELDNYDDFNYIWHHWGVPIKKLSKIKESVQTFSKPFFRTIFILVNHPSKEKRNAFKRCFPKDAFLKRIDSSLEVSGIYIPKGMLGSNIKIDTIKEDFCDGPTGNSSINFFNIHKDITSPLKKIIAENKDKIPFNITVKEKEVSEMVSLLFDRGPKLSIIMADTPEGDVNGLLKYFYSDSLIIDHPIEELKILCHKAINTSDENKKREYFEKAHQLLLKSGYVIPLGRPKGELYYPNYIKNIHVVDEMLGFPLIEKFKL